MAYQIVWTSEADNDFRSIILYLQENWSESSAKKFADNVFKKLEWIATKPLESRQTSNQSVQIIKLDRKNVLFFTIENNYLVILSIYPYKKDITKSKYY